MEKTRITKNLRKWMDDCNGEGAWRPYIGSQLEADIVKFIQNKALGMSGVTPRFCFVCGTALENAEHGWLQCESEDCGEMFIKREDDKGNQHLMLFRTPLSPK